MMRRISRAMLGGGVPRRRRTRLCLDLRRRGDHACVATGAIPRGSQGAFAGNEVDEMLDVRDMGRWLRTDDLGADGAMLKRLAATSTETTVADTMATTSAATTGAEAATTGNTT